MKSIVFKLATSYIATDLDELDKLIISSIEEVWIRKQEGYYEKVLESKLKQAKAKRKQANKPTLFN